MNKNILAVCLILMVSLSMAGVVWSDIRLSSVTNAEGLYGDNAFIGVHSDGASIIVFDALTGDYTNIVYAAYGQDADDSLLHASGYTKQATIHQVIYTSNGRLFYTVTVDGTVFLVEKTNTALSPMMYNGEAVTVGIDGKVQAAANPTFFASPAARHIVIDSGVSSVLPLREDNGNLYYVKGTDLYQMSLGSVLPTNLKPLPDVTVSGMSHSRASFDIIDGVIYQAVGYRTSFPRPRTYVWKDDQIIITGPEGNGISGSLSAVGSITAVGPDVIYVQVRAYWSTTSSTISGVYNSSGGYISSLPGSIATTGVNSGISVLNSEPIGAFARHSSGVDVVTTEHTAIDRRVPVLPDSQLDITGRVTSRQASYFNNTPVDARIYMQLNGTLNALRGASSIVQATEFELLLYNPAGQITGRYAVPNGIWEYDRVWNGINSYQTGAVSRTVEFQPPNENWTSGVYTFRLVETGITGETRMIAQHSITVAAESGSVGSGTVPAEDVSSEDIFSSAAFKAMLVIVIPALALGIVAGLPGALVGMVLGIFLSFAMGLIGLVWVILTIFAIITSFASMARDTLIGGGGAK